MEADSTDRQHNSDPEHPPKPLPIYIQNVTIIPPLLQLLEQVAPRNYETKALANNQVKVQPHTLMTALHSSHINLKKNEDSANVGIAQELQKTNDYSTELHKNLNNFSSGTEILASGNLPTLYPPTDQSVSCPLYPNSLKSYSSNGYFHSTSTTN
jgi:hypothetical protein